ncbi:hypothetical protein CLHOM_21870 [Clostridium homopropionicum DSM 5847]|uniref:Polymerase/histidinol phosphatase N-terminal domain-containing protein n=2 Tax=Clostridium TaxID=1485 RepID=A0A0L6Z8T6_9CLOT|nr:PHP domain-containing protein [Clostridium homopropionicum]KOA19396.1 hypothetical protein CLHOM_21870 [Clostridium homopropionicum DSM 5847]SFG68496.1 hypothetical protein SAMN04488501_11335 [Clostridium homopropionicum]
MIDLHCHTNKSDNSMNTYEILKIAEKRRIKYLAITDHDTTLAIYEAISIGKQLGIEIIPGIEISAFDYLTNKMVHILGYYIDPKSSLLNSLCKPIIKMRNELSKSIVKHMIELGYDIHWELVKNYARGSSCVNKKHIMQAILDKGYRGDSPNYIYDRMLQLNLNGGMKYLDVNEAIKAISLAGGVPVLAHPGVFDNYDSIENLVKVGLKGIEVEHPSHSERDKVVCKFYCSKFNLIETGGSDFHGIYGGVKNLLGCSNIDLDVINQLKDKSNCGTHNLKVV